VFRARTATLAVAVAIVAPAAVMASGATATRSHRRRAVECHVPGRHKTIDQLWHPDMRSAIAYARSRVGDIAFAVRTDDRVWGYRANHVEWSASVVKAMLMVAYLDQRSVARRRLNGYDRSLLWPMITASDNNAADQVYVTVGPGALYALARRIGLASFSTQSVWGKTTITAGGQTKFFLHIDRYVAPLHRAYAMLLLSSIVPYERWGIGEVAPKGWTVYFKGGWGSGTGLLDHQVALIKRGCARVSIAVLSMYDGSHAYGKATLRAIFQRLLHRFPVIRRRR
jgi:beta-lactamase class A